MMRSGLRRIFFTCAAGLLSVAVVVVAIALPGGKSTHSNSPDPGSSPLASYALARPVYPDFPAQPVYEDGMDWDRYYDQFDQYYEALNRLRGDDFMDGDLLSHLRAFAHESTRSVIMDTGGENAVYSPLSAWSALAMLARCADGQSRRQLLDALGVDSVEQLDTMADQLWRKLYTEDGLSSLVFSNSIWLNETMAGSYNLDTVNTLARQHRAASFSVPMGTPEADRAVSDWTAEQTRGLIGTGDPIVQTKAETLSLLLSSLYYKAGWRDKFIPEANTTDTFTAADGTDTQVEFMHQSDTASFVRTDTYQAAWLPTHLGTVTFVLPNEGIKPEQLLQQPGLLTELDSLTTPEELRFHGRVEWSVPKFDADSDLDLMDTLRALGIEDVIDPHKSDLSALSSLPAFVSQVRQLARVSVDEEGVEAAAVTIIMMDATGAPMEPEQVCVMDLDRPFLFTIQNEGVTLFVGIINQV